MARVDELVERVDGLDRAVGVVGRREAIRERWLHRIATTVCRDPEGRVLVYRRPDHASRFAGCHEVMFGGAVGVGESYELAAARELVEELGVVTPVRFLFKFRCDGAISPYWLGVHEAVISGEVAADPREVAWYGWMTPERLALVVRTWPFVPDGQEAYRRYLALSGGGR
jgi:8-oxo-dGTP pyrophosphatase MutT (NUDIX family)